MLRGFFGNLIFAIIAKLECCAEIILNINAFESLFFHRAYPDYYEVIKQPIALSKIRSQIKVSHVKAD